MLYIQKRNMLKEIGFTVQTGILLVLPKANCQLGITTLRKNSKELEPVQRVEEEDI